MDAASSWLMRQWTRRGAWSLVTWPLHALMGAVVRRRRRAYLEGRLPVHTLPVPVVVVGNRVVGGAGKTPTVIAVVEHLRRQGREPGVLSRGYGRRQDADAQGALILDAAAEERLQARDVGDECWLIWRRTAAPMGIGVGRADAGRALLAAHPEIDILVCDDGLQHLALARQVEIVVFDERGGGNGRLLPAGLLREPIDAPAGPGTNAPPLVLYNATAPTTHLPGHVTHKKLHPLQPWQAWWQGLPFAAEAASFAPVALDGTDASQVWALAGIAQPQRFFESLRRHGLAFTPLPLPDHARFDTLPWPPHARHVILTEKDAVKLSAEVLARERPHTTVWVAALDFQPEPAFWQALDGALAALPPPWQTTRSSAPPLRPSARP